MTDRPGVTSTILGARTLDQLDDNLAAADLHLDPDETARLDAVSEPVVHDYPYGELGVQQREPGGTHGRGATLRLLARPEFSARRQ